MKTEQIIHIIMLLILTCLSMSKKQILASIAKVEAGLLLRLPSQAEKIKQIANNFRQSVKNLNKNQGV